MPCPHNEISIVQRSQQQSAVAAAAYQSGEKLFCGYDQEVKHYPEKRGILNVTLTNKTLPAVILPRLNEQQREIYIVMQQLKGNKPYLWEGIYTTCISPIAVSAVS